MSKSQRDKGKAGERELCAVLNAIGLPGPQFRRGRQYAGHPDAPDIVGGPDGLFWECKRCEQFRIEQWMEQAVKDAGDKFPVIAYRKNGGKWLVTLRVDDLPGFIAAVAAEGQE